MLIRISLYEENIQFNAKIFEYLNRKTFFLSDIHYNINIKHILFNLFIFLQIVTKKKHAHLV